MARTPLLDGEDARLASLDASERDPLLDTQETPATAGSERDVPARHSARALYVPSPLPMVELKKRLAQAAEEEAMSAAPTDRPPPMPPTPAIPIQVSGIAHAGPMPPPDLEKKIDQRFKSVVDSEEARGNVGGIANPMWGHVLPVPPGVAPSGLAWAQSPEAEKMALAVQPVIVKNAAAKKGDVAEGKPKRSKLAAVLLFILVLSIGGTALLFALGKFTKNDALRAMASMRSAVVHVAERVKRR